MGEVVLFLKKQDTGRRKRKLLTAPVTQMSFQCPHIIQFSVSSDSWTQVVLITQKHPHFELIKFWMNLSWTRIINIYVLPNLSTCFLVPSQVSISSVSLPPLPNMERFVVSLISAAFHKVLAQSLHLLSLWGCSLHDSGDEPSCIETGGWTSGWMFGAQRIRFLDMHHFCTFQVCGCKIAQANRAAHNWLIAEAIIALAPSKWAGSS